MADEDDGQNQVEYTVTAPFDEREMTLLRKIAETRGLTLTDFVRQATMFTAIPFGRAMTINALDRTHNSAAASKAMVDASGDVAHLIGFVLAPAAMAMRKEVWDQFVSTLDFRCFGHPSDMLAEEEADES